jgi:hypothetical protein
MCLLFQVYINALFFCMRVLPKVTVNLILMNLHPVKETRISSFLWMENGCECC